MQRRPDVYLELALIALRRVGEFLEDQSAEDYLSSRLCQSAVERQLGIAGDALGELAIHSPEVFQRIPDGDVLVAIREVLALGTAALDHRRVYETAAVKTPTVLVTVEQLLAEYPEY